jgi:hypothetical protein
MELFNANAKASKPPEKAGFLTDATDGQRQGYWRMPTVALHYVLTGDKGSFNDSVGFMKLLLNEKNWETGAELNSGMSAANIMVGAALTYDWLYNDLDPEFREQFRQKLLFHARAMYHGGHLKGNPGTHYWQNDPANNHRWHRNAGMVLSVLTSYTGAPEEQWLLNKTKEELEYIAKWLPEDGTCHEGPTYAIFGNSYLVIAMDAADRCYGTQFLQQPFFKNAGKFLTQSLVPDKQNFFHFGDAGGGGLTSYSYFLYRTAGVHKQPDVYSVLNEAVQASGKNFNVTAWMPLIWYDPTVLDGKPVELPKRAFFDDIGVALIRDGWTKQSAAAMFKSGPFGGFELNKYRNENGAYINVAHDDPDANSFILYKNGDFLAETDRYSQDKKSSHFNTILVNGMGQMAKGRPEGGHWTQPAAGNTDMTKMAYVTAYKEAGDVVIVEGEASGSYLAYTDRKSGAQRPDLEAFRRTFIWVEGKYVLVLDDIKSSKEAKITWLMQGPKLQAVDEEKGTYTLSRENENCPFQVVSEEPMTPQIVVSAADHRSTPLGWQQLQLSGTVKAVRLSSVYDLWSVGDVKVELKTTDAGNATVTVTGKGINDTWKWQSAKNVNTASVISGSRDGKVIGEITEADTTPHAK